MSRPVVVELAEALIHLRRVAFQQRKELDEFRDRLDVVQGMSTMERRKVIPLDAPEDPVERVRGLWKGVWTKGTRYAAGSLVTDKGSLWHCNEPSFDRPGTSSSWTLALKRGRAQNLGK